MKKIIISIFIFALIIIQSATPALAEGPVGIQRPPPPPLDPIAEENINLVIDLIEFMGFPQKAAAARKMLKEKSVRVEDTAAHGYCDTLAELLIIDIDDIHPWHSTNLKKESIKKNALLQDRYAEAIMSAAITIYHELVHCLQQNMLLKAASGAAYTLTLGDRLDEMEAHAKDIQFTRDMMDRLDEIYKKLFGKSITPALKEKIMKELAKNISESYQFYNKYQKPSWVKDLVYYSALYSTPPGQADIISKAIKKAGTILKKSIEYKEPPKPDKSKSITEIDSDLGFLRKRKDYFEFTDTDWMDNIINIHRQMKDSAFRDFTDSLLGKRTNINFLYEDGKTVKVGVEKLSNGTFYVRNEAFTDPVADLNIPRLTVANLFNASNFYEAAIKAYKEGKIEFKPNSLWEKIRHFAYDKITLPYKSDKIKNTKTNDVLTDQILKNWEDLLAPQVASGSAASKNDSSKSASGTSVEPIETSAKTSATSKTTTPVKTSTPATTTETSSTPASAPAQSPTPTAAPATTPVPATKEETSTEETEEPENPVCGNNKLEFMETCDGDKFSKQCLDSLEDYKKMWNNPNLTLRCFNNCRGCETAPIR